MIKTFNINLAGQIFSINEDAYEQMSAYFNSLRTFYANENDKDEIIKDIEARFAEIFIAKGKNYIITKEDTTSVINTMGNPQDFDSDNSQDNASNTEKQNTTQYNTGKRLYRDTDNNLIGGVCAGLSAYLGINDPIWIRLFFILLTIIGVGSPVIIYCILYIIMPKAITSAQKLEMRGEPINLSNIEKKIKDEADSFGNMVNNNDKGIGYKILNIFVSVVTALVKIFLVFLRIFGVIILSLILLTIIGLIIAFIVFSFVGTPVATKYFFDNSYDVLWITIGGLLLLISIFTFAAVLLYRRLYNSNNSNYKKTFFPLLITFLLGVLMLNIGSNNIQKILAEKKKINQTFPLNYAYKSDTLQLTINPMVKDEQFKMVNIQGVSSLIDFISDNNDKFFPVEIEIYPSNSDSFIVVKEYSANGKTVKDAIKNATSFSHNISQVNNKLIIDPYLNFENDKLKYRNQSMKIKVYVPEGKIIKWDARTEKYINIDNIEFNWDNVRNSISAAPAVPSPPTSPKTPVPPVPPTASAKNHKIEIHANNKNISVNINSDAEDINDAIDKVQEKIEEAQERINDSLNIDFEDRLQRQHYVFKMVNGELVPLD